MIDIKTLLPEVQKLLPGVDPRELMQGIQQFMKVHPNFNNQQAIQALMAYLQQQKQGPQAAPAPRPFGQSLLSNLPTGAH